MEKKELQKSYVSRLPENASIAQIIDYYAGREGITPEGITILGGKPYVNVTGLDTKVKGKCQKESLVLKSVKIIERLSEPTEENGFLCGRYALIEFFDKTAYTEAIQNCPNLTIEIYQKLEETFTYSFFGEGWASPDTCEGIAYSYKKTGQYYQGGKEKKVRDKLLIENVIMMAERKATNRAKREATGTGMTSVEEAIGYEYAIDGNGQKTGKKGKKPIEDEPEEEIKVKSEEYKKLENQIMEDIGNPLFKDMIMLDGKEVDLDRYRTGIPRRLEEEIFTIEKLQHDADIIARMLLAAKDREKKQDKKQDEEPNDDELFGAEISEEQEGNATK